MCDSVLGKGGCCSCLPTLDNLDWPDASSHTYVHKKEISMPFNLWSWYVQGIVWHVQMCDHWIWLQDKSSQKILESAVRSTASDFLVSRRIYAVVLLECMWVINGSHLLNNSCCEFCLDEIKIVNVAIIYKQDIHNEMKIVRKKNLNFFSLASLKPTSIIVVLGYWYRCGISD